MSFVQKSTAVGMLIAAVLATPALATDLLTPSQAEKLGLVEAWRRQMQVPAGAQSIVDQQIYVVNSNQIEYIEVTESKTKPAVDPTVMPKGSDKFPGPVGPSPDGAKVFSRFRVAGGAESVAKEEAERRARQQVRVLSRRGVYAQITTRTIPEIRLYTLGNDGALQCQDAETGEVLWLTRVGKRIRGYGKLGIGDKTVSVINGSEMIAIDAASGEEINVIRMISVPIHGAIHSGDFALVTTIRGGIECYHLSDTTIDPFMELVSGQALAPASKIPGGDKIGWGTDRGFVYVVELSGSPSVLFRLNTDGIVSGKLGAVSGDRFFFGSESGQVYAIKATRTGEVLWSKPFGEPFYNQPLVHDDSVLLRSTYGSLYSLSIDTGIMQWDAVTPGVDELIACFDDKIYVRMLSGIFGVIDFKTGKIVDLESSIQPRKLIPNFETNRLFLVADSGFVQCLKPIDSDLPEVSAVMFGTAPEKSAEEAKPTETKETPAKGEDPFGAGAADPFGAGAADPFGAGAADPFGGDAPMADPFGGDPFGN